MCQKYHHHFHLQVFLCSMSSPHLSHSSGTHWTTQRRTCTARLWRTWPRSWLCFWQSTLASERNTEALMSTVGEGPSSWGALHASPCTEYQCGSSHWWLINYQHEPKHVRITWWNDLDNQPVNTPGHQLNFTKDMALLDWRVPVVSSWACDVGTKCLN